MTDNDADPSPQPDPFADEAAADVALLRRLAELNMAAAESLARRVAETDGLPLAEAAPVLDSLSRTLSRTSRAVRQSLALKARVIADLRARQASADEAEAQERDAEAEAERAARGAILREEAADIVRQRIERDAPEDEREDLFDDLRAFQNDARHDADYAGGSVDDLVGQIRRSIGLTETWARLDDEDFEDDETRQDRAERLRLMPELAESRRAWGVDDPAAAADVQAESGRDDGPAP